MDFRILGPVEVSKDGRSVDLGGPLERAILARLLVDAGRVVSVDRLIEDLWEGEPPGSANVSIRRRVSKLRKALSAAGAASTITTRQPGYLISMGSSDSLDASRFTKLIAAGRAALQAGDSSSAMRDIEEALSLWRGPPLTGIGDAPFARVEAARLEETRLEAQILAQSPDLSLRATPRLPETPALPTGVVTFLLSDIEGSTELWETHPVAMADVLERHDRIIAHVIGERGGHLIKSKGEGDATLSVFRRATDAVAAALDLGHALSGEPWRDDIELRVRMAIHTGEAHERDGDYFGPAVNRAARVRSLARGGQFLLSQVAAELVRDNVPAGAALADLGERTLRGLARAEHVFELVPAGSESTELPAVRVPPSRPPLPEAVVAAPDGEFVGRELELERLGALLKQVAAGGLRAVFTAGEPGIGKTRLCSEFARIAYEEGAVVLYGRSDEEPLVPYQPFVEAIRRWAAALSPEARAGVPHAEYLAPLVTEFAASARPAHVEEPEAARYRFFEAIASALEHATIAGPVLIVLDDLHWADRPTLQLLQHVLRTRGASPILVLGTYRESELARTRPLAEAMADFRRERAFERIALSGLDEEEIFALLERTAEHDMGGTGRALARALSQTTEGNPFFIEQILGNLVDTGRLVLRDGRWVLDARVEDLGIPEGVVEAIGRRLSRLSDACNKSLAAASVLGRDFDVDILTRVLERDPDEVLAAIEEALRVGLVRELPARGRAACTFSHALVQQALYEELSLARKQRLHLKAAAAIETAHAADIEPHVTALARHLRAAGAAADPDKAIEYSVRAMDAARRVFAFEEGIGHGESALELMEEQGMEGEQRARLHERLGDMYYVAGAGYERSFAHFETALRASETLGEETRVAVVHIKLGRGLATYADTLDTDKALEHLRAAEQILGPTPNPRLAGPLALGLAAASLWHLDVAAGSAAARRAMEIGQEQGSESIWATGAAFEGWALGALGRFDDAAELLESAWTVADRLDNVLAAFASSWIRFVGYQRDPSEMARIGMRELSKPRQAQAINARRSLLVVTCGALACAGNMNEARSLLENVPTTGMGHGVRYFAESFEVAERRIQEDVALFRAQGNRFVEGPMLTSVLGSVQWARGATERARSTFEAGLDIAGGQSLFDEYESLARLAILEAGESRAGVAAKHISRCEEILAQGNGWRGYLGFLAMAKGAAAVAGGRLGEGEGLFVAAIEIFKQYGLPFEEAETLQMWGHALVVGDPQRAIEKFDAALEIYTSRSIGQAWIDRALADHSRAT